MKNKGLVFSLATLFLLLSIILLEQSLAKTSQAQEEVFSMLKTYQKINEDYLNISENLIELDTKENPEKIRQRLLPFKFSIDKNTLSLEYNVPIRETTIGKYFDAANAFKIFYEDKNHSNYYHNVNAVIFTKKNSAWGGTESTLNFTVEPSCMNLLVQKTGITLSDGWCASFDLSKAQRIDANISITTQNEDLNAIKCSWNESTTCPNQSFNPLDPNPYLHLKVLDENCADCALPFKEVTGHFDTTKNNWVTIRCEKPSCVSDPIDINASDFLLIKRNEDALSAKINLAISLKSIIEKFYYDDINISLTTNDFNIKSERPR